jgi:hypothetical protein
MKSCRWNLYFLVCTCALDTYEENVTIQDQFGEGKVKIIQVESEEFLKQLLLKVSDPGMPAMAARRS